jgi:hypothetical protein
MLPPITERFAHTEAGRSRAAANSTNPHERRPSQGGDGEDRFPTRPRCGAIAEILNAIGRLLATELTALKLKTLRVTTNSSRLLLLRIVPAALCARGFSCLQITPRSSRVASRLKPSDTPQGLPRALHWGRLQKRPLPTLHPTLHRGQQQLHIFDLTFLDRRCRSRSRFACALFPAHDAIFRQDSFLTPVLGKCRRMPPGALL